MGREATVRWDANAKSWRSDVGPRGKTGRRTPMYFRKDEAGTELPETKVGERGARRLLREYLDARDESERATPGGLADPTVEQLRLLWLSHVKREQTKESYAVARSSIGQFARFTHTGIAYRDRRASGLTATDMARFLDAKRADDRKPNYLAKLCGVVQAMLNWAANPQPNRIPERLLAGGNPLKGMAAPKVPESPERFAETKSIAAFLRAWLAASRAIRSGGRKRRCERSTLLLVRLLVQTGCRPGEACKAEWSEVEWNAGRTVHGHVFGKIVLPPEKWKAGKKTGKARTVYLTPGLTRGLRREYARDDRHPTHLFHHIRRKAGDATTMPWTSAALAQKIRKLRRLANQAGAGLVDTGPNRIVNYLWRHTAASRALMRGMDPVTVAALLGTSPQMLQKHYGHILDSHLTKAAEELGKARRD